MMATNRCGHMKLKKSRIFISLQIVKVLDRSHKVRVDPSCIAKTKKDCPIMNSI